MFRYNYFYMVLRQIIVTGLLITYFCGAYSQDIHFSMFNTCPLFLNPANTGNFTGDWRIAGNFRNQWSALSIPYNTASISFDKHFYVLKQKIGGGAIFINDQSGSLGLSANKFYGSAGYSRIINNHVLTVGLQLGFVYKSLNFEELTLPSQWNTSTGQYDPDFPSNETNMGEKVTYLDVNLGLMWKKKINIFEPEAGISLNHINFPKESFFDAKERLPLRYIFHTRVKTNFSDHFYISPAILYMSHKKAREMVIGSNAGFNIFGKRSNVKEIIAGIYLRNDFFKNVDAFSILGGATIGRIDVAICYDYNISNLKVATNNVGAFEISFIYKSISTVLNSYSIPCERF